MNNQQTTLSPAEALDSLKELSCHKIDVTGLGVNSSFGDLPSDKDDQ